MDFNLLNNDFWRWVESHLNDDPIKLRLKYHSSSDSIDYDSAILQIECRKRFGKKLSDTISADPHFYFPSKLAGEQSTSDRLANFHSSLVLPNLRMVDLTAGLGIDVMHCAGVCESVIAIERNSDVADSLRYNCETSGINNVEVVCSDCRDELKRFEEEGIRFDTAFIDPARRAEDGSRVYSLPECEPDVTAILPSLSKVCRKLIVKMSPMLDISHTISALGGCKRIIALGTATECKELIAVKDFGDDCSTIIDATTLLPSGQISIMFSQQEENESIAPLSSLPVAGDYLYEPYPAVMKSGANKILASRFGLSRFHNNTRLYHSHELVADFPGEAFIIEAVVDFSSKFLKRFKKTYPVINVATRNFGMSAESLRNKLGVKDGGCKRVIGITDHTNTRRLIVIAPNNDIQV